MQSEETFLITNATHDDYEAIHNLFRSGKIHHFGERRRKARSANIFFSNYITHRILIRISDTNPTIIGYAEVTNSPYIPALPEDSWMDWLKFHYCCDLPISVTNACFFNTFIYNKDYNPELMRQVLCEIFYRENKLRFIITPECPNYGHGYHGPPDYYCVEQFATVFYPKCFSVISCSNTPKLHVILRDNLIPKMRYRKALPEDNDDIVEVVNADRPELKQQLGDFYIAEELLSDAKSLIVVTEISHTTAGFIWINDHVDILPLLENYDLEQFGFLIKFDPKKSCKEKQLNLNHAQRRPLEQLFTTDMVKKIYQSIEAQNLNKTSNLSICSNNIESKSGRITSLKDSIFKRDFYCNKLGKLCEKLKSSDYYIQLRKRNLKFYYNIPDDEFDAPFDGNTNVFVIQLFGLMGTHDYRRIFRYLFTSFAAYPDKDYCLLSVCVTNHMTSALFEMLKYFIRVTPRSGCKIDEHLYITHRSAVYGDLSLFPVRFEDVTQIKEILAEHKPIPYPTPKRAKTTDSKIPERNPIQSLTSNFSFLIEQQDEETLQLEMEKVLEILSNIFEDPFSEFKCFTIRCGDSSLGVDDNKIVGFAIIRPFHLSKFLKKHFHMPKLDEFMYIMMAELVTLKLHPLFHFQADVVFRELARQSNYWYFYHFRTTNQHCLSNDLLISMQPLEPRRTIKVWFDPYISSNSSNQQNSSKQDNSVLPQIDLFDDQYAAFQNNLQPSAYFGSSTNIVILGVNDICKAFLILMIFNWHGVQIIKKLQKVQTTANCLPHVNITVICGPGIMEADYENSFKCADCYSQKDCWINFRNSDAFIRDVTERMDVRNWIRFVSGKVSSINSQTQLIKLESECEVYYETLLLMCDKEFGVPENIFSNASYPPNYSHINNRFDKILFYHKLKILKDEFSQQIKKSIVVYGSHIKAFEFIDFLIKHDIKGSEIHLVMPDDMANVQLSLKFNNSAMDLRIEEILRDMVEDLDVAVYERMHLKKFSLHKDNENIKSLTFLSSNGEHELTLECDLFVSFYETYVAKPLLEIFKESYLDINKNYVMVDQNYQTSEPNIYAIGNFIKHKIEPNHQYIFVSSQEAAEKIINVLDLIELEKIDVSQMELKFSKPSYFQAQLPMNYFFVKVIMPKRYLANHLDNEYGVPLVTYNDGEFSRVRLNQHGVVEEIVIVTQKKMDYDFLKFFCGRHELLLNNLKSRWYLKEIKSFINFFQEPWVELLMHDNFEILQEINENLINPTAQEIMKKNIDRASRHKLMLKYGQGMNVSSKMQYALIEFIREHRQDFCSEIALPEDFPIYVDYNAQ